MKGETLMKLNIMYRNELGKFNNNTFIVTENNGQLITSCTYWGCEREIKGGFYVTLNAGAVRLICPRSQESTITEMQTAREVIMTKGLAPLLKKPIDDVAPQGIEIMFEDNTSYPFAMWLNLNQFESLPSEKNILGKLVFTVWKQSGISPQMVLKCPCYYRTASSLPCLKPR